MCANKDRIQSNINIHIFIYSFLYKLVFRMVKMQSSRHSWPVFHFRQIVRFVGFDVFMFLWHSLELIVQWVTFCCPFFDFLHTLHADVLADIFLVILTTSTYCGTEWLWDCVWRKSEVSNLVSMNTVWPNHGFTCQTGGPSELKKCRQSAQLKLGLLVRGWEFAQQLKLCNQTHTHIHTHK